LATREPVISVTLAEVREERGAAMGDRAEAFTERLLREATPAGAPLWVASADDGEAIVGLADLHHQLIDDGADRRFRGDGPLKRSPFAQAGDRRLGTAVARVAIDLDRL
jgi:hypothetical protein